tara:strand:- start:149 stop:616 length:468 start_codon:yes stop_codon:yes gene_type:complete
VGNGDSDEDTGVQAERTAAEAALDAAVLEVPAGIVKGVGDTEELVNVEEEQNTVAEEAEYAAVEGRIEAVVEGIRAAESEGEPESEQRESRTEAQTLLVGPPGYLHRPPCQKRLLYHPSPIRRHHYSPFLPIYFYIYSLQNSLQESNQCAHRKVK